VIRYSLEALLLAAVVVLWVRENRLRAYLLRLSTLLGAYMAKALADRSPWVRVPAETMAQVLGSKVRWIPTPRRFNSKPGRHPATERKVKS